MDALTRPLTPEEQKRDRLELNEHKGILFEGTIEKAEEFYEQVEVIPTLQMHPTLSIPTVFLSMSPLRNV